jgi:hypothetical protein
MYICIYVFDKLLNICNIFLTLYCYYLPFGVFDADSMVVTATGRSLFVSLDGTNGGESGGFVLLACEYKSKT